MVRRIVMLLAATTVVVGTGAGVSAQRPPTVAAAANLNFALTEIANQFERDEGTRVELVFGASGTLTRQIQDGAPFEMFLAADEEFPNQLSAGGSDARCRRRVRRRPAGDLRAQGSPLAVDERLDGPRSAGRRPAGSAASRSPILTSPRTAAPRKRCCGSAGCGTRFARTSCSATASRRPRSSRRRETPSAAWSPTRWCSSPGFAERGTYAVIPDADHPPLRQRMVLLKRAGADRRRSSTPISRARRRARDSPETRLRGARIAADGLDGPCGSRSGSAQAPSRSCSRSASGSGACWRSASSAASCSSKRSSPCRSCCRPRCSASTCSSPSARARRSARPSRPSSGQSLPFSFEGLLLASAIANIPFVVQPIQRGFEAIPPTCAMPRRAAA